MRKGGGKQKGSQFERDICKRLSLWVSDGKQADLFWRSAMSGGRATVELQRHIAAIERGEKSELPPARQAGDITAVAPEGHILTDHWYIECKHYADLALKGFFLRDAGLLYNFWEHTYRVALSRSREPLLIAKENGCPTLALTSLKSWNRFDPSKVLWTRRYLLLYKLDDLLSIPFADFHDITIHHPPYSLAQASVAQ